MKHILLPEFEKLLKRTMGLDTSSVGSSIVMRAVQARMSACEIPDLPAYWQRASTSRAELQELVEAVVIPETWFFRDRQAFAAMVGIAHEERLANQAQGVLRLLSLPCSSGEEPFSMAMALLDAGFPANRFVIDAVDISARALSRAERAIYGRNSFRGTELDFRDRHFARTMHGHQLAGSVREHVEFRQGNLFDCFPPGAQSYAIIFCRNVLIYFDGPTQRRAIAILTRLLSEKGALFVGPSETGLLIEHGFVSTKIPLAFAFRRAAAVPDASDRDVLSSGRRLDQARANGAPRSKSTDAPTAKPRGALPPRMSPQKPAIQDIRRLADQGRLAEAGRWCEQYLRDGEASAETLHILGLIRDAAGNLAEAASYYRKALYLDPNHDQALIHLALLLENQGDKAGAKMLSDRMRRLDRSEIERHG